MVYRVTLAKIVSALDSEEEEIYIIKILQKANKESKDLDVNKS